MDFGVKNPSSILLFPFTSWLWKLVEFYLTSLSLSLFNSIIGIIIFIIKNNYYHQFTLELNEIIYIKHLTQNMVHSKYLANVSVTTVAKSYW